MRLALIAAIAAFLMASFVAASPVRVFGAARGVQANSDATPTEVSPDNMTNAQRMARGLPPLKPRSMGSPTVAKRQGPSPGGTRRRRSTDEDEPTRVERRQTSPGVGGQRRSTRMQNKRDRYAGVYGSQ
ncbi:hypothetical protein HDZ31DRAFT_72902 [Schizophyllum fasciatum]